MIDKKNREKKTKKQQAKVDKIYIKSSEQYKCSKKPEFRINPSTNKLVTNFCAKTKFFVGIIIIIIMIAPLPRNRG